ncbi:MAG: hypothetical protein AAFQ24_07280 [Pseudomonadota bacterium]
MSDELDQERIKTRRRMRGVATFFIVVSIIGAVANLIRLAGGQSGFDSSEMFGLAILLSGILLSALAAWQGSRIAGFLLLVFFAITPVSGAMGWVELRATDWVRAGLYISLTVWMLSNSFRYHKLSRKTAQPIGGVTWLRWGAKLIATAQLLFIAFGVSVLTVGLSTSIIKGAEVSEEHLLWLTEQGYLMKGERPLYLNLDGAFSIADGGSLLTDLYVVGWWQEDGEQSSVWIKLGEICEVKDVQEGNAIEPAIVSVHSPGDESSIQLWLSIEGDLHQRFLSRMKAINGRKMRPEIQAFCDQDRAIDWDEIAEANGISRNIIPGSNVTDAQRAWLEEQGFLLEQEEILQFYSSGNFAISEGGAMLTNEYIGGWWESSGELRAWWGKIGEICDFSFPEIIEDESKAHYRITIKDGDWLDLSLPTKNEQGAQMVKLAIEMNTRAQTDEHRAVCQASQETVEEERD